jgi:hypothetical protein
VELDYLLTHHLSLRFVGFYANALIEGDTSHQVRSALATVSYRF